MSAGTVRRQAPGRQAPAGRQTPAGRIPGGRAADGTGRTGARAPGGPVRAGRCGLPAWLAEAAREAAALDDTGHAVRLLAATPTHEHRDPALLRHWAETAAEFGAALAAEAPPGSVPLPRVVERTGGLDPGTLLLARYRSRPASVELFTDTLEFAERTVAALGWRGWYPPGSVRAAALAHETVHLLLHGGRGAELKRRLGHHALRLGPLRVPGHVAGADEVAAHAYAQAACGLGRSPLLLTAVLGRAVAPAAGSGSASRSTSGADTAFTSDTTSASASDSGAREKN